MVSHFPGDCFTELSFGSSSTLRDSTVAGVFLALVTKARKDAILKTGENFMIVKSWILLSLLFTQGTLFWLRKNR